MKTVLMMFITAIMLLSSSTSYAAPAQNLPVRVDGQGVTFPDNTLQTTAAILPVCQPGEVYVKADTGMLCAKIKLIPSGIATCIDKVCTVSSCADGIGNCDVKAPNVCGTDLLNSVDHCGACGIVCSPNNECQNPICSNGACSTSNKTPGTICSTGICDGFGSCAQPVCGDGIVSVNAGEQCDDGNVANGDGCSNTCITETGYNCAGSPSFCNTVCGDGIVAGFEECDDGNRINTDTCSNLCFSTSPL